MIARAGSSGAAIVAMSLSHMYFLLLCGLSGLAWIVFYGWFDRKTFGSRNRLVAAPPGDIGRRPSGDHGRRPARRP